MSSSFLSIFTLPDDGILKKSKHVAINYTVRYHHTQLAFRTSQFIVLLSSPYCLNLFWGSPSLILSWSSKRKSARNVKLKFHTHLIPGLIVREIVLYLPSNISSCLICTETTLCIFTLNGNGFPKELNRLGFRVLTCRMEGEAQTFSEMLFYEIVLCQEHFKIMLPVLSLLRSPTVWCFMHLASSYNMYIN